MARFFNSTDDLQPLHSDELAPGVLMLISFTGRIEDLLTLALVSEVRHRAFRNSDVIVCSLWLNGTEPWTQNYAHPRGGFDLCLMKRIV